MDGRLLISEKNSVLILVNEVGISSADFTWSETGAEPGDGASLHYDRFSLLRHNPSGFFYRFGYWGDKFSPGPFGRVSEEVFNTLPSRAGRPDWVKEWLELLRKELTVPDLWAEVLNSKSLSLRTALTPSGDKFTEKDMVYLSGALQHIETKISNQRLLTESQGRAIHSGFEEIKAAMNRFGKKDWASMATGLLFNIMVAIALSGENSKKDFRHVRRCHFALAGCCAKSVASRLSFQGFQLPQLFYTDQKSSIVAKPFPNHAQLGKRRPSANRSGTWRGLGMLNGLFTSVRIVKVRVWDESVPHSLI